MIKNRKSEDEQNIVIEKTCKEKSCKEKANECCCKIKANCDFEGIQPAIVDLPYPELQVKCHNKYYASLLQEDFSGIGSELTAIAQYINHELAFSTCHCELSQTLIAIALAEMDHLQMLGELIVLLGEPITYNSSANKKCQPWNSDFVFYGSNIVNMLISDIRGEYAAIDQYADHIRSIKDPCIQAVLARIIKDEEYHIELLSSLLDNLDCCSLDSCKNSK